MNSSEGYILIDTGEPGRAGIFWDYLREQEIDPIEIKLIILTHAHYDHAGNCKEIKDRTGAKVLIHRDEVRTLQTGMTEVPRSTNVWGSIYARIMGVSSPNFEPLSPDIVVEGDCDLMDCSLSGKILHTPGHTRGSISVLLDSGEAFVGDLLMPVHPFSDGMPLFAEDTKKVVESWQKLLAGGAERIYPSHGKTITAEYLNKLVLKYVSKFY